MLLGSKPGQLDSQCTDRLEYMYYYASPEYNDIVYNYERCRHFTYKFIIINVDNNKLELHLMH